MPLTHALLSIMLGVRRAGVTTTLREFERRGLVLRYRARIDILDRQGLVVLANGYYGTAEEEYRRVIGRNELPH